LGSGEQDTDHELVRGLVELVGCESVVDLRRLSGGASRETYAFDAVDARGDRRSLILQRERRGSERAGGIETEAALLAEAKRNGVPVPALVAAGEVAGARATVLERIEGETIARKLLRDAEFARARDVLTGQAARALAAVHSIPVDAVPGLVFEDPLRRYRDVLDSLEEPHPAFELGFRRLEASRPEGERRVVVHGDFRTGNLIVGPDGLRAVLDWEIAHVGDPMEDLGWFCVRAWRFGSPHPAGGFGSYDELCAAYAEASSHDVDPDAVRWWEAVGTLRWGVMCMMQARAHLWGMARSVELAAIGRRVCENEHDLLELLGSRVAATGQPSDQAQGTSPSPPHDRPTAAELADAVREYVEHDVMAATDGRVRFHARVAANVLGQIERELVLGPAQAAAHRQRLASLGYSDDAALAAGIRSGACDEQWEEVVAAVHASVLDKLAVANPDYAQERD
jgi:aminoglycoside phosphotransferase (APT) family kinase protein